MNVTELIAAVRVVARLDAADDDYTDTRIQQELTDSLNTVFGGRIVASASGFWLHRYERSTVIGRTRYRLPFRASAVKSVEFVDSGVRFFTVEGDQVILSDTPTTVETMRITYYTRPSNIVQAQANGLVTAVDVNNRTVTVNAIPTDRVLNAAVVTGAKMDIVHSNGWHELALVGVAGTFGGTTITFPVGTDLTDVEAGTATNPADYVRAAEQTDWPCLQDDYHRVLIDVTAASILRSKNQNDKSDALMKKALGTEQQPGDLLRFQDIVEPRIKDSRPTCVPTVGVLRGGWRRQWPTAL